MDPIQQAVKILQQGGLVAMPTETVYGLAADASNPKAIKKIYEAKGRPSSHPVIVHLASIDQIDDWAIGVSESIKQALSQFWPGPLTIIAKKAAQVSDSLTGGQDSIGIRIPNHPVAQALLKAFGGGLAAPSANRFGRISPTDAKHVKEELGDKVDCILEGGRSVVGIESTILDISQKPYKILRLGAISKEELSQALGESIEDLGEAKHKVRAPGMLASHYAPETSLKLVPSSELKDLLEECSKTQTSIGLLTYHQPISELPNIRWMIAENNPKDYAHELYANLRLLDSEGHSLIIVEAVPEDKAWSAIADRLKRAAS
ncbi:MAG: Sua5/YciO/YrdC/YwlC family protein [Gammaproteobacteria bacterium]|jgi:L-threonylcarbamoyladenylate synthase|nr:Sua5/YciO/YrdC/YwlC family protein [Gammaproteobacteria bacterium]